MSCLQAPVSTERLNASQLPLSWPQIDFHAPGMATDTTQVLQRSCLVPGSSYGKMLNAQHLDMDYWPTMTANLNQEVFAFPAMHSPSWTAPSSPSKVPSSRNRTMQLYHHCTYSSYSVAKNTLVSLECWLGLSVCNSICCSCQHVVVYNAHVVIPLEHVNIQANNVDICDESVMYIEYYYCIYSYSLCSITEFQHRHMYRTYIFHQNLFSLLVFVQNQFP